MKESISFPTLLLVAFIVLKLCHVIDWSWVWVLSPLWIPVGLVSVAFLGLFIYSKSATFYFKKYRPEKWEKIQEISRKAKEPKLSKWEQRLAEMQTRQENRN